jgi:adenosylcobinamide kinase/adenosylcobinamide-phosphate guanylyltransferase
MTRLLLTRHATAEHQQSGWLPGPDVPLTPEGRQQARALAIRLHAFAPQAVQTSPALRARQTAAIIAEECQTPLRVCPALREIDFGAWAGQSVADIVATQPSAQAWFADPSRGSPPGGETIAAVADRTYDALSSLAASGADSVIVVGHAGSLRLALARGLGMPLASYWRLPLDCASLSIAQWTPEGLMIERLNDTNHLTGEVTGQQEQAHSWSMRGHATLVLGGARSGKSAWAEQLGRQSGQPVLYVATATASDDEMADRIAAHRAQRPTDWQTIEEPERLLSAIQANGRPGDTVIVDCLTLWVSNAMLRATGPDWDEDAVSPAEWAGIERALLTEARDLVALGRDRALRLILVSNEVGMGVVPATPLGRRFQDILGRLNQVVGRHADDVVFLMAGIPIQTSSRGG